jgi:predicted nucleotidyltransferase
VAGEKLSGGANDILAIAYLRALKKENSKIEPIALKRKGSDYRDKYIEELDGHPSATMLRNCLLESGIDNKFEKNVPKETFDVLKKAFDRGKAPVQMSNLDSAIVASLRLFDHSKLENIAEAGGGLGRKILSSSHIATTYEELVCLAAGMHYTDARVRRTVLNILLGVSLDDLKAYPAYTTVLGFNDKGREILSELRKKERVPFITKPADVAELGDEAKRQKELSDRCDSIFALALPIKSISAEYIKKSPFIKL